MKATSVFTSRYLKAPELNGQAHLVHIERVHTRDDVLDPQSQAEVSRHILYLFNAPKGMMLNITQTNAVIAATGEEDTDNWAGKSLIIRPITNNVGMPTIEVLPYDPADTTEYTQFTARPARALPTSQDVIRARSGAYMPATPPAYVGMRPILPPEKVSKTRRQSAGAQAAAD